MTWPIRPCIGQRRARRVTAAVCCAGVPAWPSAHFLLRCATQKTSHSRGTLDAIASICDVDSKKES